jgi:hypothetical protein
MSPSRPRFMGMAVDKEAIAVAYGAQAPGAEVPDLGTMGPRQGARDHRIRKRPSHAHQLRFVYDAGPWGSWLSRSLSHQGYDCCVVAPSVMPQQPGDRVNTDRRDAVPWARLAGSGDLPAGSVPPVADEAMRERTRAREEALRDRQDATWRRNALWLRHDRRDTGRAHGGAAHRRRPSSCKTLSGPSMTPANASRVSHRHGPITGTRGVDPRGSRPSKRGGGGHVPGP